MTHPRHLGKLPESVVEICNDAVGGSHAVIGDVIPDALQIQQGPPGKLEPLHARWRRRSVA